MYRISAFGHVVGNLLVLTITVDDKERVLQTLDRFMLVRKHYLPDDGGYTTTAELFVKVFDSTRSASAGSLGTKIG